MGSSASAESPPLSAYSKCGEILYGFPTKPLYNGLHGVTLIKGSRFAKVKIGGTEVRTRVSGFYKITNSNIEFCHNTNSTSVTPGDQSGWVKLPTGQGELYFQYSSGAKIGYDAFRAVSTSMTSFADVSRRPTPDTGTEVAELSCTAVLDDSSKRIVTDYFVSIIESWSGLCNKHNLRQIMDSIYNECSIPEVRAKNQTVSEACYSGDAPGGPGGERNTGAEG